LANKSKLENTENLIIDLRNNSGGSDRSYAEILPYIYTNPFRIVNTIFYSTRLNNQRMLDFYENYEKYGIPEEDREEYKKTYEMLNENLGQFVFLEGGLEGKIIRERKLDKILPYPENVGIIINSQNGSTTEQFLLAAKQSKKVKLFGTTTMGVLDFSNMYFVNSPCNEFRLGYALSKSLRIPDMTVDGKGIQPDYYIDKSIPAHKWINFVSETLNEE
jgi:C-terminal processing protease CtpA/Prc